jgi:hypothetical protein
VTEDKRPGAAVARAVQTLCFVAGLYESGLRTVLALGSTVLY